MPHLSLKIATLAIRKLVSPALVRGGRASRRFCLHSGLDLHTRSLGDGNRPVFDPFCCLFDHVGEVRPIRVNGVGGGDLRQTVVFGVQPFQAVGAAPLGRLG